MPRCEMNAKMQVQALPRAGAINCSTGSVAFYADVVRDGDDLLLSWSGPDPVSVAIGSDPDELRPVAHTNPSGAGLRSDQSLRALGIAGQARRWYASFELPNGPDFFAAERRLSMEGLVNFRDVGGYRVTDGSRVAWDRVYRSDGLDALTNADVDYLLQLGIGAVCDLRRPEERAPQARLAHNDSQVRVHQLPIGGLAAETRGMGDRMLRGEIPEVTVAMMADVYLTILDLHADAFGSVIRCAADASNLPLIVHCTAGKDRTGVACALLLDVLGVDDAAILSDFALSSEYYSRAKIATVLPRLTAAGIDFSKVEAFFDASPAVLALTLDGLRRQFGSIEAYLLEAAGVSRASLASLRRNLIEP